MQFTLLSEFPKITTDGVITESPEIANTGPTGYRQWTDRAIWFLGYASNRVYRITLAPNDLRI